MSIKHKIKFKGDRVRGTYPAVLRFLDLSKTRKGSDDLGVEGESTRRGVPDNDNEYIYGELC